MYTIQVRAHSNYKVNRGIEPYRRTNHEKIKSVEPVWLQASDVCMYPLP